MRGSRKPKESYYVVSNPQPTDDELIMLFAGGSQTKPGHKPGPKVVDYYLLHSIQSGSGSYSCEGVTYRLGPGDSFLIEPGQLISYAADAEHPWHYRWIAFKGERAARMLKQTGLSALQPVVHTGRNRSIGLLYQRIQRAFQSKTGSGNLKAVGFLHLLLAEYAEEIHPGQPDDSRQASGADQIVQQAIRYLSTHYAEPITIELMAESLGYNRAYLSTLFKRSTGLTPVAFLLRQRVDKAHLLLRERLELTVEQIASSVGFQDPLYFSKQFKRLYGLSPTAYRSAMTQL